jgi:alcohol dehydrogenase, propanol-preferring
MFMRAMILDQPGVPLRLASLAIPRPGPGQVLVKVAACGVCRTDLHVVDGDLKSAKLPLVPGHEIVGTVAALGSGVEGLEPGQRIGVPWLGRTCGVCPYCDSGQENLCDAAAFMGYTLDGGYAEYTVVDVRYCFPIPDSYGDIEAAPLLCAGLIGFRSYRMAGEAQRIGIYGFGGAAHIITQIAAQQGRTIYAFTKPGDREGQVFARMLGAAWAGGSDEMPPVILDAALIFAPVGALVPVALRAVRKGGTVICAGIHMSDLPSFPYEILWGERIVRSVANLTRQDGLEFFKTIQQCMVHTSVHSYPLEQANEALEDLRAGRFQGAAVLECRGQGAGGREQKR